MRIQLKNFRCHRDAEFTFPDSGLVLLSGKSGQGKSTILEAISYALYGNVQKPYSSGTSTCCVTLQIFNLLITRRSRPNNLTLVKTDDETKTVYEDSEAQQIINTTIGMNADEFILSSYVKQSLNSSILSLPPAKQMEMIQTLIFTNSEHLDMRRAIKALIEKLKTQRSNLEGQLELLDRQLGESALEDLSEASIQKYENIDSEEIRSRIDELTTCISEKKEELCSLETEHQRCKETERKSSSLEEDRRDLRIRISQLEQEKASLDKEYPQSQIISMQERVEEIEEECNSIRKHLEFQQQEQKVESLLKDYQIETKKRIADLRKEIEEKGSLKELNAKKTKLLEEKRKAEAYSDAYSRMKSALASVKKDVSIPRECKTFKTMLTFLQETETNLTAEVETLSRKAICKTIHVSSKCPKCKTSIIVTGTEDGSVKVACEVKESRKKNSTRSAKKEEDDDNTDNSNNDDTEHDEEDSVDEYHSKRELLSRVSKQVAEFVDLQPILAKKTRTIEEVASDIESVDTLIQEIKIAQSTITKLSEQLKPDSLPTSIANQKKSLETLRKNLPELDYEATDEKYEQCQNTATEYAEELEEASQLSNSHTRLARLIEENKQKLAKMGEGKGSLVKLSSTIESSMKMLHDSITSMTMEMAKLSKTLTEVTEFEKLKGRREEINKLKKLKKKNTVALADTEKRLAATYALDGCYKEAESLSVIHILSCLNAHSKVYLDEMFDEPIIVRLENEKHLKKGTTKLQICPYVEYKGIVYSSIYELSQGEQARCFLAFLLAMNDLLGGKVVFLDEATCHLDADLSQQIFEYLKILSARDKKLIICVDHQSNHGLFDEVVPL